MKVNIGNYVNRWTCKLHRSYMDKMYGAYDWDKNTNWFESFLEKLDDFTQWVYNHTINLYLDKKKRKIKVKIHPYDTWGADHTLALIILPVLKQLQATKQGSPLVDDCDAPPEISSTVIPKKNDFDWDENTHKRWDYVLSEIIWAFEQLVDENSEDKFFGKDFKQYDKAGYEAWQARKQNGLRLFGVYMESLWD